MFKQKIQNNILLLFLIFTTTVLAQNNVADSLINVLSLHTEKDTTKVNLLNALALSYYKQDLEKALDYINESEIIAESLGFKKGTAKSVYLRGIAELEQSNFDSAIELFHAAELLYKQIDFKPGLADCYVKLGFSYSYKNDFNTSIDYYKKSLPIDEKNGNSERLAISFKYIGYSYYDLGDFDTARIYFDKALSINLKYNYHQETSSCYNIIGSIYLKRANYPVALEFYNKSLGISERIKDSVAISKLLNNIGLIYKSYENYDKALENYEKALEVQRTIGNKTNVAAALNNIGTIYWKKEDYNNALIHYNKALTINTELKNKTNIIRNLNNIGNIYQLLKSYKLSDQYFTEANTLAKEIGYQLGLCNSYIGLATSQIFQKKYDQALSNALKSKDLSKKLQLVYFERDVNHLLSDIYKYKNDFKNALLSHQNFKALNDSIFNKKNIEKITQLEYEYKYKQQLDSANIRELQLTKTVATTSQNLEKTQRNYLWAIIGVLLVSILLGSIIFFQKLRNAKAITQNIVIEQKLLRSQMTPHFIFNSLSVLQGMILNNEDKKSVSYLSKFSKLLRITLENSRDKTVALSNELTAIKNYLALQNLENDSYQYTVEVEDSINIDKFEIPPMLIQPFVENSIEHAFVEQKKNRIVEVFLKYIDNKLICTISDNGIGIDFQKEKKSKSKKSLATTITSER